MSHKGIGLVFLLLVVVVIVAACSGPQGGEDASAPAEAPEANTEIAVQPASFDLKPNGCDMVCVLGAYLHID